MEAKLLIGLGERRAFTRLPKNSISQKRLHREKTLKKYKQVESEGKEGKQIPAASHGLPGCDTEYRHSHRTQNEEDSNGNSW